MDLILDTTHHPGCLENQESNIRDHAISMCKDVLKEMTMLPSEPLRYVSAGLIDTWWSITQKNRSKLNWTKPTDFVLSHASSE